MHSTNKAPQTHITFGRPSLQKKGVEGSFHWFGQAALTLVNLQGLSCLIVTQRHDATVVFWTSW